MKLGSPPRIWAVEKPPRAPFEVTSRPGTKRSTSATVRAPEASMVSRSSRVTEPVAEERGRSTTVAVE